MSAFFLFCEPLLRLARPRAHVATLLYSCVELSVAAAAAVAAAEFGASIAGDELILPVDAEPPPEPELPEPEAVTVAHDI